MVTRTVSPARALVVVALATGLALAAWSASADRTSSDRAVAEQIVARFSSESAPPSSAAARPIAEARRALERAESARGAGDLENAKLLEGLAREFAEVAQDVARAVEAEADAGSLQRSVADASVRAERLRAMIDELTIRKARTQGELRLLIEQADAGASPTGSGRGAQRLGPIAPPRASSAPRALSTALRSESNRASTSPAPSAQKPPRQPAAPKGGRP